MGERQEWGRTGVWEKDRSGGGLIGRKRRGVWEKDRSGGGQEYGRKTGVGED